MIKEQDTKDKELEQEISKLIEKNDFLQCEMDKAFKEFDNQFWKVRNEKADKKTMFISLGIGILALVFTCIQFFI